MSVINQMLRDLDRHAALAAHAKRPQVLHGLSASPQIGTARWRWRAVGALAVVVWGGVWLGQQLGDTPPVVRWAMAAPPVPVPVAVPVLVSVPAPIPVPVSVAVPVPVAAASAPQALASLGPPPVLRPVAVARLAAQARPVAQGAVGGALGGAVDGAMGSAAAGAVEASRPLAAQAALTTELAVLAQAQSLWRQGLQVPAVELLNQAIATTEPHDMHADRLAALVREWARMQLLLGQAAPTLELLTRLAPVLSGYPDIWAIRGNAAQRLGQHQASVDAYAVALSARPNEPRWLLGSAVSLAMLGQLGAAADKVQAARNQGGASPQALHYLEQLGVR